MLSATKFMERTEADEATSLELVIEPFLESIATKLVEQVKAVKAITAEVRQTKLEVQPQSEISAKIGADQNTQELEGSTLVTKTFTGTVTECVKIVDSDDK